MRGRSYVLAYTLLYTALLFCGAQVVGADTYVDHKTINQYVVGSHYWTHSIPANFDADSAEIELYLSVFTFNDYGILDLFCSNTSTFDYGSVTKAPSKPGFICRITRTDAPNPDLFYTITCSLKANQVGWLNDNGTIYLGLIGEAYWFPGWPAQYDLATSTLTATGGSAGPGISRSPSSLSNSCSEGSDAPNQSFQVWNSGGGTLSYSISDNATWLSCTPTSGTSTGEHDTIIVSYTTSGLSSGDYSATITVSASGASNSPQTIPVSLTVTALEPSISISPTSFRTLDVIGSFDSPGPDPRGLAFDGTYLWNSDATNDKIYKLDTLGNIIDSFDAPGSAPTGLAFDGTFLWNANCWSADKIYQLDASGNIIDSFDAPGSLPYGLAFDGTYLWNTDSTDGKIYKLDTFGNIIDSFDAPGSYPRGLAFDGTYLWNADSTADKIYKLDTLGNMIDSFDAPGSYPKVPTGLAFDGTYLWNADSIDDAIYKLLEVPGPVNVGSSKTRTFTVTNIGTADLEVGTLLITGTDASEFSIQGDNCSSQTVAPLGTCTFDVIFSPTSAGVKSANLEIPSNDPDTPILNVPLRSETGTAVTPHCQGDFDGDGDVDGSDLAVFAADFGCTGDCDGDVDNDGYVDDSDLALFAADLGVTDCPIGFFEDFNDGVADNWNDPDEGEWSVADGVYKMTGSSPSPAICRHSRYNQNFSDFTYRVRVNRIQGALNYETGITFRSDGTWQNGYRFVIAELSDTGYYSVIKHVDGSRTILADWTMSSAINPGYDVWNTLKVVCNGPALRFYINGTLVESLDDSEFSSGQVGVMAWDLSDGDNTIVHFDDAELVGIK